MATVASDRMPRPTANPLNWRSTARPTSACSDQKGRCLFRRHLPARDRPRAGARNLGVEVAVDDVVIGAAGAAHDDGADQEQNQVPEIREAPAGRVGGQRRRPPARPQQEPPADRPLQPGEPGIGPKPLRHDTVRPVAAHGIGNDVLVGGHGHRHKASGARRKAGRWTFGTAVAKRKVTKGDRGLETRA